MELGAKGHPRAPPLSSLIDGCLVLRFWNTFITPRPSPPAFRAFRAPRAPRAGRRVLGLVGVLMMVSACSTLRPGERWVHGLKLRGITKVDASALKEGLATQKTGWWPFASKKRLDEGALDKDVARIRTFYARRGFFRAKASHRVHTRKDKRSVDVTFEIVEGTSTTLREIRIDGLEKIAASLR
ncbi:MAG: hypothetical protein KAI47_23295, partial [Deltaproteobacteria bacterium]|nr:hypothetical protein [Deltaproteobacteria bacterium]